MTVGGRQVPVTQDWPSATYCRGSLSLSGGWPESGNFCAGVELGGGHFPIEVLSVLKINHFFALPPDIWIHVWVDDAGIGGCVYVVTRRILLNHNVIGPAMNWRTRFFRSICRYVFIWWTSSNHFIFCLENRKKIIKRVHPSRKINSYLIRCRKHIVSFTVSTVSLYHKHQL